jgi:hypothetical protein
VLPPAGQQVAPSFVGSGFAQGYTFTPTEVCVWGYKFWRGIQNVLIQYTAGYDPVPPDVEQATIELVVRKYRERTRVAEHSRSLGGAETVQYSTVTFSKRDIVTDIEALLWQYRQVAPLLSATLMPPTPAALELEDATTVIELEDGTPIVEEAQ